MEEEKYDVEAYTDAKLEEGESIDGSREQDSLYDNELEANKQTNTVACTNTMNIDINSEPGSGRAEKSVDSNSQTDSATEIPKSKSESLKVVRDKYEKISTGHVGLDI